MRATTEKKEGRAKRSKIRRVLKEEMGKQINGWQ